MESKHPIQAPNHQITKAHLYICYADVVCGLCPPCCTSCPRLPQVATAKHQYKHQLKPPNSGPSTLSVEVAHNAMRNQPNSGALSWPSTI
jgi:hypothetical protein